MKKTIDSEQVAQLVRADTALQSFRDAGYSFGDAVGEIVDNSIQASARKIKFDWTFKEGYIGKSKKIKREIVSLAIADDGQGISPAILPHVLTVGFSTRYNNRDGIGRFGVGFKLASISQAKRLEIYTCPTYLNAEQSADGNAWSYKDKNKDSRIFMSYLDLDEIGIGKQKHYAHEEVDSYPEEYKHLMDEGKSGTLIVWRKIDRMNDTKAFSESADEKIAELRYFLSRTYRIYINNGIEIFLPDGQSAFKTFQSPIAPYDPTFQIDNPVANHLAPDDDMKGEEIEKGKIIIDGEDVEWRVFLTPKVTRLYKGAGGNDGPRGNGQFRKLHIPDNQGKISFLRHNREVSYTKVPHLIPADSLDKNKYLDRFIAIEVLFSPILDEYFQVRHIKRGVEPVNKLKSELKNVLEKPILTARKRIRDVWKNFERDVSIENYEISNGGRTVSEEAVKEADAGMPVSRGGQTVSSDEEKDRLIQAANDVGIIDADKQEEFISKIKQLPIVALDVEWAGRGLLDIEHLNSTILVRINRRHPFIKEIYLPLKAAIDSAEINDDMTHHLLKSALESIDLLLFAYAKAESMSPNPEENYLELREDWGKFTAVYLRKRDEMNIG